MSQLDELMEQLKRDFDKGTRSRPTSATNVLHSKIYRAKKKGDLELVRKLSKEARKIPATNFRDSNFKRLSYVRYADD